MNKQVVFNDLVKTAMAQSNRAHMRPVIEKELLHYDILFALDQANLLDQITFQGGTALRLCYGAQRFSEDLDFAGGTQFKARNLAQIKQCLESYLGERYGLAVTVKEPKISDNSEKNVNVHKWQLIVTTAPERKDLPRQCIKIEVANVPAYTKEPHALQRNYDFLPDGYNDTLVFTESINEIMADKLISFVCATRKIRHRDIWDLRWLKEKGAVVDKTLVNQKIKDYHISNYANLLEKRIESLEGIIHGKAFLAEMSRFLDADVQARTLQKEKFLVFLTNEIKVLLLLLV